MKHQQIIDECQAIARHAIKVSDSVDVNDPIGIRVSQLAQLVENLCAATMAIATNLDTLRIRHERLVSRLNDLEGGAE